VGWLAGAAGHLPLSEGERTMAQIVAFPRTLAFTRAFEELPLFTDQATNGDVWFAGLIDGEIEISANPANDWWISGIHIVVENACRAETGTKTIRLDPDEHGSLYWLVLDTFTNKYSATIEEWVREAAAEAGLRGRAEALVAVIRRS
jgi:hypothetical protein